MGIKTKEKIMYPKTQEQFEIECAAARDLAAQTGKMWMVEYEDVQYYFTAA